MPFSSVFKSILTETLLLSSTAVPSTAQWLNYPTFGIPRTADGKPNLSAAAPKAPDGKPDLSGIWVTREQQSTFGPWKSHFMDLAVDLKPEDAPFQPWAKEVSQQRQDNLHKDDPLAKCMPPGVPRINTISPFKIVQTPRLVIILYETTAYSTFRQIFTDGRPLLKDPQPTWLGYSTGTWEGDVLKVDTLGFNDRGWIDTGIGRPQTEALHVIERFRRVDFGNMEIAITIDDPKAYTKPWTTNLKVYLLPDTELLEMSCENSRGTEHMVGK
ncbi:MAG TPA: hypothetical protein VI756_27265 [Blastocatellia bacterium]